MSTIYQYAKSGKGAAKALAPIYRISITAGPGVQSPSWFWKVTRSDERTINT